jgi:ribonuclease PH
MTAAFIFAAQRRRKVLMSKRPDQLRTVTIQTGFMPYAEGSALVSCGNTKVICTASIEENVPPFLIGKGQGWLTAVGQAIAKLKSKGKLTTSPLSMFVAAVSVGIIKGVPTLDLCYEEDVNADVDCNVAMTEEGKFVEIQGTAEHGPFSREDYNKLIDLAVAGIKELITLQKKALGDEVLAALK